MEEGEDRLLRFKDSKKREMIPLMYSLTAIKKRMGAIVVAPIFSLHALLLRKQSTIARCLGRSFVWRWRYDRTKTSSMSREYSRIAAGH